MMEFVEEHFYDSGEDRLVIYTPFTKSIEHVVAYVKEKMGLKTWIFQGGMDYRDVMAREEGFRKEGGCAICSIKFAESFELETSKLGYFTGFDWDPNTNYQAEGRMRRLTSDGPRFYYYIRHEVPAGVFNSVEERVWERINEKQYNVKDTFGDHNFTS